MQIDNHVADEGILFCEKENTESDSENELDNLESESNGPHYLFSEEGCLDYTCTILITCIFSASPSLIAPIKFNHAFFPQGGYNALQSLSFNYRVLPRFTVIFPGIPIKEAFVAVNTVVNWHKPFP